MASRRGAEDCLREGRVRVNGVLARLGDSADPAADLVTLDGRRVAAEPLEYWIAHKPVGVVTTVRDPQGRQTVRDLVPDARGRVVPVGRLDRDTEGLVILTNDGPIAHALLHPSHGCEREYRVTVQGRLTADSRRRLERGVPLDGKAAAAADVSRVRFDPGANRTSFTLVLTEGRKRQIRRSLRALGHPVRKLVRVRMGTVRLGRLAVGQARPLRREEVRRLQQHATGLIGAGLSRD